MTTTEYRVAVRAGGVTYWLENSSTETLRRALCWHEVDLDGAVDGYLDGEGNFVPGCPDQAHCEDLHNDDIV